MKRPLLFFFTVFGISAQAEILSIPENCFVKEVTPCLIQANESQNLKSHSKTFVLELGKDTIFKVMDFKAPYQFELLQGKISLRSWSPKKIVFRLNDIAFDSNRIFAEMAPAKKMRVYDSRNFILSDYEVPRVMGEEMVIAKSEFLSKVDMIRYLSGFFSSRKSMSAFLKSIEAAWKVEFQAQTHNQTMVLKRSVASLEKDEADQKRRQEENARELKKVRELFFYRTFQR